MPSNGRGEEQKARRVELPVKRISVLISLSSSRGHINSASTTIFTVSKTSSWPAVTIILWNDSKTIKYRPRAPWLPVTGVEIRIKNGGKSKHDFFASQKHSFREPSFRYIDTSVGVFWVSDHKSSLLNRQHTNPFLCELFNIYLPVRL